MAENVTIGNLPVQATAQLTDIVEIERPGDTSYQMSLQAIVTLANDEAPAPVWGTIVGTLSNQTDLQLALDAKLDDAPSDGTIYGRQDAAWVEVQSSTVWGTITGTLSDQTDLQNALDAKANLSGAAFTGAITSTSNITSDATVECQRLRVDDPVSSFAQIDIFAQGERAIFGYNAATDLAYLQGDGGFQFLVNGSVSASESIRLESDGTVVILDLAGTGTRDVQVQADGTLIAV